MNERNLTPDEKSTIVISLTEIAERLSSVDELMDRTNHMATASGCVRFRAGDVEDPSADIDIKHTKTPSLEINYTDQHGSYQLTFRRRI